MQHNLAEIFAGGLSVTKVGDREYRVLELDNKLQVLLIFDPKAKKSAASMDINIGSLADPQEHQGLAHFLEHMLFLGTKKYPKVGEYDAVLAQYQGHNNAYTSREHTNYFFEVTHDGFRKCLDRFGQFFIAPLFTDKYVGREKNAVNSEHLKNIENDTWRQFRLSLLTYRQGHPASNFSTGNNETLKNADNKVLVNFYRRHYSANSMKLAIISRISLDDQEVLVTDLFSQVKNNNRAKLQFSSEIYDDKLLPQRINLEPVADIKELQLGFAIPSTDNYWRTKPHGLLSSLIGDEGKGSLLSLLKKKGYVIALSSYNFNYSFCG